VPILTLNTLHLYLELLPFHLSLGLQTSDILNPHALFSKERHSRAKAQHQNNTPLSRLKKHVLLL
jgi:hypothetical protein